MRITHFLVQDTWSYIEFLEYKEVCARELALKKEEGASNKSLKGAYDEMSLSILQKSFLKVKPFVKELIRRMIPNESENDANSGEDKRSSE